MSRELDERAAEALGLELVGLVSVYRDPDCGYWCVGFWGDELRPAYVSHCVCDILDEVDDHEVVAGGHVRSCLEVVPCYSEDIVVAWGLVETMIKGTAWECYLTHQFDGWDCAFERPDEPPTEAHGDTAPEAICLAFLAVKEE